jgi:hypothetical protein
MIRINLVDNTASIKHVDFNLVPVTNEEDFACTPAGILSLRAVMCLSRKIQCGRTFGEMGKYLWYRLKVIPSGKHKTLLSSHW